MTDYQIPVLEVTQLGKRIGKKTIVNDLSFSIKQGEIFGFLGPNGAGKTTTIRMLVGLIRPTSGTISIGGFSLEKHFTRAISQVGCIVENPELYPYLTGRENLQIFARMLPSIDEERIDEVVQLVKMEHRIDEVVKTYSLGMRQRLGIAQALLGRPKLLILDEPTNGLDPSGIRELRSFIRYLAHDEGISVFVSSHILHEVQLLCDRVAIIHQGQILQTADIDQLISEQTRIEWHLSPIDKAIKCLQNISFISSLESDTEQNKVWVHMPPSRIAETNQSLIENQIAVMSIQPYQKTLEDIFLELTRGDTVVTNDESNL
ncbi:ABC-2 type transport system ATP-binding protein [Seinonella peptonophila]|uniref:ABC-2 type transport system ATP-binding protein n=1 Tax=Seinonella peptonophila TaxID=112248 RepID=A0A1M4TSH1_9BACL|nr:ABC transporter ATP-binding protein [Seinonella peptonophila]SHE47344.1 ABC-2 type transport system ATP-binding protein [Seinonella peptonophila]